MLKAEWGVKRTCLGCGARFYDLKRAPIVCPKCGEELEVAVLQKPKREKPKRAKPAARWKTAAKGTYKKADDLIDDGDVVVAKAGVDDDDDLGDVKTAKAGDDDLKDN